MKQTTYLFIACLLLQLNIFAQVPNISYGTPQSFTIKKIITPLQPINTGGSVTYGTVTTFAGNGTSGSMNGNRTSASFNSPLGIAIDAQGNMYVADCGNQIIRKITSTGTVTTFAGSGTYGSVDGVGLSASFWNPSGIVIDASGNLYVSDSGSNKIRKITPTGTVTTFAGNGTKGSVDGIGTAASFNGLGGLVIDSQNNLYAADTYNRKIRKITPAGVVTTFAGNGTVGSADGTSTNAGFYTPAYLIIDSSDNIYVSDFGNKNIRKITPQGVVTTLAISDDSYGFHSNGLSNLHGIAIDVSNNIYVSKFEFYENNYRYQEMIKLTPQGVIGTLAGNGMSGSTDGVGVNAKFLSPTYVVVDASSNVYIADTANNKIRKISAMGGYTISPELPTGLYINSSTGVISGIPYVASPPTNYTITATNNFGTSTSTVVISINSNLSVEDVTFKNMVVYPNPTTGEVNINNVLVEKVNVYNNVGQLVKTFSNKEATNNTSLQLNNLPTGTYYLHIDAENAHTVKQIIKQDD